MGLRIITPPTVTPISVVGLDALKEHLREATDISDDDAAITSYLNAAWNLAEAHTWRQFLTAEYRYTLQHFCAQRPGLSYGRSSARILIPRPPCQSVESVKYIATDGTLTTLVENTDYVVDLDSDIASIAPASGKSWPSVLTQHNAVQIEFTAGYATPEEIPAMLIHAVKLQVGSWWLNRESVDAKSVSELPNATKALLEAIQVRDDRLVTNDI